MVPEKIETPKKAVKWYEQISIRVIFGILMSLAGGFCVFASWFQRGYSFAAIIAFLTAFLLLVKDEYYYKYRAVRACAYISSIIIALAFISFLVFGIFGLLWTVGSGERITGEVILFFLGCGFLLILLPIISIILIRRAELGGIEKI